MGKPKERRRPWVVASRDDAAAFFDVSVRVFADWITAGAPRIELGPRKFLYDLKAILAWRREQDRKKEFIDDPDIEGPDSPNLEKLRYEKYRVAKVVADKAEGLVVDRAFAWECMQRFASVFRRFGELLKTSHPDIHELLNDTLAEAREAIRPLLWKEDDSGSDDREAEEAEEESGGAGIP